MQRDSTEEKIWSAVKECKVASRRKYGGVTKSPPTVQPQCVKLFRKTIFIEESDDQHFSLVVKWKNETILTTLKMRTAIGRSDVKSLSVIR